MKDSLKKIDATLVLFIFLFMIISCISIHSAQRLLPYPENFALKQGIWYIVGFGIGMLVLLFDFDQIRRLSSYFYGFGILLLVLLLLAPTSIAPITKGAKAWFSIPGFGSLQPSEFMKVFLIMFLGRIIVNHNEKYLKSTLQTDFILIGKVVLATLVPLGLILKQPDAGTAMVITTIMIGMLFVSGISWKLIVTMCGIGLAIFGTLVGIFLYNPKLLLLFLDQYQLDRIYSWLDPFGNGQGIGYQLKLSILAIGSGMTKGNGYMSGAVSVPEAHSDFIFTIIAEEWGFIGASIVVTLYFLLIYKICTISFQNKGNYESYISAGVISMLTFHIFENIGMVIGLVPITGIPLPLLSYGGSSILATMLALSLIINISAHTNKYMFGSERD